MGRFTDLELQDIETTFVDELADGGLPAAERYIAGLDVEMAATATFDETVTHMEQHEDMMDIYPLKSHRDTVELIDTVENIHEWRQLAVRRHKFATAMLDRVIVARLEAGEL